MTHCPGCGQEMGGLASYCDHCEAYTADLAASTTDETPAPAPSIPDDRSEAEIRMAIRTVLELHGCVVVDLEQGYRRDGSTRVRKGLPDLAIMAPGGVFAWRELKSANGRLRPEQEEFGDDCRRLGIDWDVWRHEDQALAWVQETRRNAA